MFAAFEEAFCVVTVDKVGEEPGALVFRKESFVLEEPCIDAGLDAGKGLVPGWAVAFGFAHGAVHFAGAIEGVERFLEGIAEYFVQLVAEGFG